MLKSCSHSASPPQPAIIIDESEVEELPPAHTASNYRITDDHLGEGGPKDKYTFNMYAIIMLKQIESENRAATPGEQDVLAHYVGWGGIPEAFDAEKAGWEKEYQELQSYLTPEEYNSARASVLNSHYTSPVIIKAIYAVIGNMGCESGKFTALSWTVFQDVSRSCCTQRLKSMYADMKILISRLISLTLPSEMCHLDSIKLTIHHITA